MRGESRRIGIAVVEHEGCYLVGIRGPQGPLPGCAEFPGGKCGEGESAAECAVRECREETGLKVVPRSLLLRRQFDYPHGTVDLHFWLCSPQDEPTLSEESGGFRWIEARELASLDFPEANAPVIEMLARGFA